MSDKQQKIISMFDDIANSYDLANRVMSCGIDIAWRKKACNLAFKNLSTENLQSLKILDVACGTGDMITHWQKNAKNAKINLQKIVGADPSSGMLEVAKKSSPKLISRNVKPQNYPFWIMNLIFSLLPMESAM